MTTPRSARAWIGLILVGLSACSVTTESAGTEPVAVPTTDPAQTVRMEWGTTEEGEIAAAVTFDSPDDRQYDDGAFVVGDLELTVVYTNDAKQQDAESEAEVQRLQDLPVGDAGTDVVALGVGYIPCDRTDDGVRMRLAWTDAAGDRHLQEYIPSNLEGFVKEMRSLCG